MFDPWFTRLPGRPERGDRVFPAAPRPSPTVTQQLRRNTKYLLRELGSSPTFVAQRLERTGARGYVGEPDRSPLGVLVRTLVGTEPSVSAVTVTSRRIRIMVRTRRRALSVWLPLPVRNFLTAFDHGAFPKLAQSDGGRQNPKDALPGNAPGPLDRGAHRHPRSPR